MTSTPDALSILGKSSNYLNFITLGPVLERKKSISITFKLRILGDVRAPSSTLAVDDASPSSGSHT